MTATQSPDAAVTLIDVSARLGSLYTGLAGHSRHLLPYADAADPKQFPDTEDTMRLPPVANWFGSRSANLDWYRAAIGHRALHDQFGTFEFAMSSRPTQFSSTLADVEVAISTEATEFERFFSLFGYHVLAEQIFSVVEDVRVEFAARQVFRGLDEPIAAARSHDLSQRAPVRDLPTRQAFGELLVQLSLGADPVTVPAGLVAAASAAISALALIRTPGTTVADSAEVALRLYALMTGLPNLPVEGDTVDLPTTCSDQALPAPDRQRWPDAGRVRLEGDEVLESSLVPVSYRDELWPRFQTHSPATPQHQELIYRLTPDIWGSDEDSLPPEDDHHHHEHDHDDEGLHPIPHEHSEPTFDEPARAEGHLEVDSASSYVYDEWDCFREEYRRAWCRVREEVVPGQPGSTYYHAALERNRDLIPTLRRMTEDLRPERFLTVGRQREGDDIDLDAAIEAMIDLRAGRAPSDGLYLSRVAQQRDVSVAILVDMSSSTAESLDSTGASGGTTPRQLRILDVEMDSVALLSHVLDALHDNFAIYGFSGSGRAEVQVQVFKEFDEQLTAGVLSRFDNANPISGTRMGAAIRHASDKLSQEAAETRILIVLSDGRPYDMDYGQEYGDGLEMEYGARDVGVALEESHQQGVRTFLLTVDRDGLDYLRDICGDSGYEVLEEVALLPSRLLALYGDLAYN